MFKKSKALVLGLALTVALPTTAFGALLPSGVVYGSATDYAFTTGPNVINKPNGDSIEYFQDVTGKVFTNCPKVTTTVMPESDGSTTIKYAANLMKYADEPGVNQQVADTGAYMTVSNVLRQTAFSASGDRLLYVKGPTKLTFSGSYLEVRKITQISRYEVDNGNLVYSEGYDDVTGTSYQNQILDDINYNDETATLTNPGLYFVQFDDCLQEGVDLGIIVTDGTEDVSYHAPTTQTATAMSATVNVTGGKHFTFYGYTINGDDYIRVRDLAYMLNGTAKTFDVIDDPGQNAVTLNSYNSPAYTVVGDEMETTAGTETATPTTKNYEADCGPINPPIYNITGVDYVKLTDIAKIMDFGLTNSGGVMNIDTNTGYANTTAE